MRFEQSHGKSLTRVEQFTRRMFKEKSDKTVKLKGGEAWGVLLFVVKELETFPGRIPHQAA